MDAIFVQTLIVVGVAFVALVILTAWAMCRVSGRISEEERFEADIDEVLERDLSVYCAQEGNVGGYRNE